MVELNGLIKKAEKLNEAVEGYWRIGEKELALKKSIELYNVNIQIEGLQKT